jgi:UDP-N-acetylmuramoyl-tripeptide--D-alanyl-D-alanine ligase
MKEFSIETLSQVIKAAPIKNIDGFFTGVSTDSRTVQKGDCFFAVKGENYDGHDYVADAFTKGAACAVVSKDSKLTGDILLRVDDTIKALGDFAAEYRQQGGFKVVAITGSVGKTTTRQIAYHVLSQHYHLFQSPKNFNNNIGLPLTLLGASPEDKIIIAEIGSNCPGEVACLTRIAKPDIAVVTNVYPAHLTGFGDLQTIVWEKLSIVEGLESDGVLIINADFDRLVNACRIKGVKFITFGKSSGCDIQAKNITHTSFGSSFAIEGVQVHLPLFGLGNVDNALAAWAVCSRFGLTIDDFANAVKTLSAVPMRAELLQIGTLTVLNDCYNANPASMKNALDIIANLDPTGQRRLVFICGDMAELGQQSEQLHAELGASVARARVGLLLTVGNLAKIAAEAAKKIAKHDLRIKCFKDTASAGNNLQKFIKDYDIILVKGSRVAKLEMVVEKLKAFFGEPQRELSRKM